MGVVVDDEHPVRVDARRPRAALDQVVPPARRPRTRHVDPARSPLFEEAFLAVVDGRAEDDGFNRLVLGAGLAWREVALLARVLPLPPPDRHAVQPDRTSKHTLAAHADIARPPRRAVRRPPRSVERRPRATDGRDRLVDEIRTQLDAVTSLDEDRILRALLHLVLATLRTNWFQTTTNRPRASC